MACDQFIQWQVNVKFMHLAGLHQWLIKCYRRDDQTLVIKWTRSDITAAAGEAVVYGVSQRLGFCNLHFGSPDYAIKFYLEQAL